MSPPGPPCPGCGRASRDRARYPWPPRPNPTDLPEPAPGVPYGDWRCRFCAAVAVREGALRKRLGVQRRLLAAGAMRWPPGGVP